MYEGVQTGCGRMPSDAVGDLTGNTTHDLVDRSEMDGNVRVVDRARIEQWHHQVDIVMITLDIEFSFVLPAIPDRAHGLNVFPHPWSGR